MDVFRKTNSNDSITLYFVQDVGSNSREMRDAFMICQNAKLNPNLVGEDEIEDLPARMNCVYVLEEFKGKTFNYLASKDCLVVGPRCLKSCVSKRVPIPENESPVFNLAMHGLVICASKLKRSKKEELATVVGYMGGSYIDQFTLAVTHLVADDGKSVKCEKAYELKIPVMSSSWVKAVWEASLKDDITAVDAELLEKHKLPIFKGLHISCSNIPHSIKLKLQKIIEQNGGVYMPSLEQNKTNILIIGDPVDGKKFQHSQLWGIPCVKITWIHECIENGYPLPFKDHIVNARPTCSTPTSELPSFMSNDVSVVPLVTDVSNVEINDTNSSVSSIATIKGNHKRFNRLPETQSNNNYKKHLEQLDMTEVNSAGLFLDGCKIYLSGFINQEIDKLKKVLNIGGATIFSKLTDTVSHVIIGEFNIEDAKAIAECSQRPHVVSVEWLLASIRQKNTAPVQQYLCLQANGGQGSNVPPQLASPLRSKGIELLKEPNAVLENAGTPLSVKDNKRTSRKLFVKAYKPNRSDSTMITPGNQATVIEECKTSLENNGNDTIKVVPQLKENTITSDENQTTKNSPPIKHQVQQQPTSSGSGEQGNNNLIGISEMSTMLEEGPFFQGLIFLVVGFEDASPIIEPIEKVGGTVMTASQFQGVADYAIVPLDGTPERFSSTETVTVLWVEDCWEQRKVLPVEYYHQPVTMKEGCCPLKGVTLCITGFVGKERSYIGHVATSLGAIVQDSFSRKDHPDKGILRSTHLVCKSPQGSKYTAAKKWSLPAVTKEWLIVCAATGQKLPEENYNFSKDETTVAATTSLKTAVENPMIKKVKTSSLTDEQKSGGCPTIVETTPLVAKEKQQRLETIFAEPKPAAGPSRIVPTLCNKSETLKNKSPPVQTAKELDEQQNNDRRNIEEEEENEGFQGFLTPQALKTPKVFKLQLDESGTDLNTPNNRRQLSCSSLGPSPGRLNTPSSPYGQVLTGITPSPHTRKRWKKWIETLPDLYESPVLARKRKPSTPLNILMKQLWVKFGGVDIEGIQPDTGDLIPDGPYAAWAHDNSHHEMEVENGEIVIKGTNISSADISCSGITAVIDEKINEKPSSFTGRDTENKEGTFYTNRRNLSSSETNNSLRDRRNSNLSSISQRCETEFQSSLNNEHSSEELSPSQQKEIISERLARRIKEVRRESNGTGAVPVQDSDVYNFVEPGHSRGVKRKSEDGINSEWDWTPLKEVQNKSPERNFNTDSIKRISNAGCSNASNVNSDEKKLSLEIEKDNRLEIENEEENDDDDELENTAPKQRRIFVLSNIPNPRDKYESIIQNLGGEVNTSLCYDPETTHIIIERPVRSEKLLCCIASGKWVLHLSYLTSCYQARTFLPEEDYEWGNERSKDRLPSLNIGTTEYELAMSAHSWRMQRTELGKVGAYNKFKAVLLTQAQKIPQYTRLLEAGGAAVLDKSQIMEATHIFWDEDKVQLPVSKQKLRTKKILLLRPIYLGDFLMKSQQPKIADYLIK